jgi:hypothetical protein
MLVLAMATIVASVRRRSGMDGTGGGSPRPHPVGAKHGRSHATPDGEQRCGQQQHEDA